jgi:N-acetylmuramoyl-L-alanine amidase
MNANQLPIRAATDFIAIHCSASQPSRITDAKTIDGWHKQRGFQCIGYHYVIKTDGEIQAGRPENTHGAHVEGHNSKSLGICLIGGVDGNLIPQNNFTKEQMLSLLTLLKDLRIRYPKAKIQGHRDFPKVNKACPSFDVNEWMKTVGLN